MLCPACAGLDCEVDTLPLDTVPDVREGEVLTATALLGATDVELLLTVLFTRFADVVVPRDMALVCPELRLRDVVEDTPSPPLLLLRLANTLSAPV